MKPLYLPHLLPLASVALARIDEQVDTLIDRIRSNGAEVQRLVLDSMRVLAAGKEEMYDLSVSGSLRRIWSALGGDQAVLRQQEVQAETLHAALALIQKLRQQQLLTVDLVTVVNNKLNWLAPVLDDVLRASRAELTAFFEESRRDLLTLEQRVEQLERNEAIQRWVMTVQLQRFDGMEYADLDPAAKVVCLVSDFFRLSGGRWTGGDLSLLRSAMGEVALTGRIRVRLGDFFTAVAESPLLIDRLLQEIDLTGILSPEPEFEPLLAGAVKLRALAGDEAYVCETVARELSGRGIAASRRDLELSIVQQYLRSYAGMHTEAELRPIDLAVDLLVSLQAVKFRARAVPAEAAAAEEVDSPVLTVAQLAERCGVEPPDLLGHLRELNRLEREEDVLPGPLAQAAAAAHNVELTPWELVTGQGDVLADIDWLSVPRPEPGLVPGHIPKDGSALAPFAISRMPVTRRQFCAAMQRLIDRYVTADEFNEYSRWAPTRVWVEKGALYVRPDKELAVDPPHYEPKADKEQQDWATWFYKMAAGRQNPPAFEREGHYSTSAVLFQAPVLYLEGSGIDMVNGRLTVNKAEEDLPVTGVTIFGAMAFCDQLERAGLGKVSLPSARHYASLNWGLAGSNRSVLREWCAEEFLYAGVHQYDRSVYESPALANVGFRVVQPL